MSYSLQRCNRKRPAVLSRIRGVLGSFMTVFLSRYSTHPICLSPSAIPIRLTRRTGGIAAIRPTRNETPRIVSTVAVETSNTGRYVSNCA